MTYSEIRDLVEDIEESKDDPEKAHCREDELREKFLEYLLNQIDDKDLKEKIGLVLSTSEIDFARWCA